MYHTETGSVLTAKRRLLFWQVKFKIKGGWMIMQLPLIHCVSLLKGFVVEIHVKLIGKIDFCVSGSNGLDCYNNI